jgi:multidrug resistance efflux pump
MIPPILRRATAFALLAPLLLCACAQQNDPPAAVPAPAYAAVARGRIDVEGGLLSLGMPREGTLAEVDVREGERVQRGQPLASLDLEPGRLAVAAAQAELDQARAQLALLGDKLAAARGRARRLAAAERAGAGDGPGADEAHDAATELAAQQTAMRAGVAAAGQKLAGARFELAQRTLRAPIDADVVHVAAQPGASVSPQAGALFVLLPRTPRIVRADLSEAYVDAVRPGMPALVSAEASPDARPWHAHVLRVGAVVGPSALEDDPQLRANSRTVECVLAFDTAQTPRVGQRVMVRFGVDAVPVAAKGR